MTREEAIDTLKAMQALQEIYRNEAVDMAIKALEQEPAKHGEWVLCSYEGEEEKDSEKAEELERLKREIRWIKIVIALWFTGEALIHFLKLMGVLS